VLNALKYSVGAIGFAEICGSAKSIPKKKLSNPSSEVNTSLSNNSGGTGGRTIPKVLSRFTSSCENTGVQKSETKMKETRMVLAKAGL